MVNTFVLLLVVAAVLGLGALVAALVLASGRTRPALPAPTWRAAHTSTGGQTRVVVQRRVPGHPSALEERVLGVVADDDPDYDGLLLTHLAQARARAELLNGQDAQDG